MCSTVVQVVMSGASFVTADHIPHIATVKQGNNKREREFIFQVRQTKYYSELINTAKGYQNRQTPI